MVFFPGEDLKVLHTLQFQAKKGVQPLNAEQIWKEAQKAPFVDQVCG
jgi:hypothetical protein